MLPVSFAEFGRRTEPPAQSCGLSREPPAEPEGPKPPAAAADPAKLLPPANEPPPARAAVGGVRTVARPDAELAGCAADAEFVPQPSTSAGANALYSRPARPRSTDDGGKGAWLVSRAWKVLYGEPASLQITRRTAREKFQHRFPLDLASDICIAPSGEVRRKDVNPARHAAYGGWNGTLGAGCGLRGGWNGEQAP